jgi:hypothetical protein
VLYYTHITICLLSIIGFILRFLDKETSELSLARMPAARTGQDSTQNDIRVWHPGRILSRDNELDGYALLVLNQPIENLEILKIVWEKGKFCQAVV